MLTRELVVALASTEDGSTRFCEAARVRADGVRDFTAIGLLLFGYRYLGVHRQPRHRLGPSAQLQPHFLFNALNTISSAVYEDPRKADAMIAALSDLLRHTVTDAEAQVVPLDRELATLDRYLEGMRKRFEDKLCVDVLVGPGGVRIRDRGRGLSDGHLRRGTGISNTAERLVQLYGIEHRLAFDNCEDGGLLVTVAVPYRT